MGLSLWREDGPVDYNCCWPSPAQSFSGPSPLGLAIIFYCLRFETSLLVASYHLQGYLHTRDSLRMNYVSLYDPEGAVDRKHNWTVRLLKSAYPLPR
jgi:hypothetical protein